MATKPFLLLLRGVDRYRLDKNSAARGVSKSAYLRGLIAEDYAKLTKKTLLEILEENIS